jgi:hypothetical protein
MKIVQPWIKTIQAMNLRREGYDFPHHRSANFQGFGKPFYPSDIYQYAKLRIWSHTQKLTSPTSRGSFTPRIFYMLKSRLKFEASALGVKDPPQPLVLAVDMDF